VIDDKIMVGNHVSNGLDNSNKVLVELVSSLFAAIKWPLEMQNNVLTSLLHFGKVGRERNEFFEVVREFHVKDFARVKGCMEIGVLCIDLSHNSASGSSDAQKSSQSDQTDNRCIGIVEIDSVDLSIACNDKSSLVAADCARCIALLDEDPETLQDIGPFGCNDQSPSTNLVNVVDLIFHCLLPL